LSKFLQGLLGLDDGRHLAHFLQVDIPMAYSARIRKFTRNRNIYPNEESALKIVHMAVNEAAKKWTMPIRHWKQALNHFAILYEGRMPEQASN
jgi:hypothetical protein